jgi:hypothetical protein
MNSTGDGAGNDDFARHRKIPWIKKGRRGKGNRTVYVGWSF